MDMRTCHGNHSFLAGSCCMLAMWQSLGAVCFACCVPCLVTGAAELKARTQHLEAASMKGQTLEELLKAQKGKTDKMVRELEATKVPLPVQPHHSYQLTLCTLLGTRLALEPCACAPRWCVCCSPGLDLRRRVLRT